MWIRNSNSMNMSISKGIEFRMQDTKAFSSGKLLTVLRGLRTLIVLTMDMFPPSFKIPIHPITTTSKSIMFQGSLR